MILLRYINNVGAATVCRSDISDISGSPSPTEYILNRFQACGFTDATDPNRLFIRDGRSNLLRFKEEHALKSGEEIVYNAVIALSNAYEYCRKDGIVYFFHTSEKCHREYPHIHAGCGGEEISIYFSDLRIVGKTKSRALRKKAVDFVRENLDALTSEWQRITAG